MNWNNTRNKILLPLFVRTGALRESSNSETGSTEPDPTSILSDALFETGLVTTGAVGLFSCTRVGGFGAGTGGGGG